MKTLTASASLAALFVLAALALVFPWAFAALASLVVGGLLAIPLTILVSTVWREITGAERAEAVAQAARTAAHYAGKKLPR